MSTNEGINNGVSMVNNLYNDLKENNVIYIGLIIVILLCVLTIYFLYYMIGKYLFLKVSVTVSETSVPVLCNKVSVFNANFPDLGNGRRKSFSFWIYINDFSKNYGNYKTVVAVLDNNDLTSEKANYRNASPHIFLDKTNNKLYCNFYNKNSNQNIKNFSDVNKNNIDNYMKTGIIIDYIPLQRWVHVAYVINSDSFTTSIYAYVDADLVKIIKDDNNTKNSYQLNDIDLTVSKYLIVGGDIQNVKNSPGFSGLISNFTCYNYELNQSDISNIYEKGPVNGFLAYLGLGMYGVRNPIYKL